MWAWASVVVVLRVHWRLWQVAQYVEQALRGDPVALVASGGCPVYGSSTSQVEVREIDVRQRGVRTFRGNCGTLAMGLLQNTITRLPPQGVGVLDQGIEQRLVVAGEVAPQCIGERSMAPPASTSSLLR